MEILSGSENKKKRKSFSLIDKLSIIEDYDKIKSVPQTAAKYNVAETTLRGWIKNRSTLEEHRQGFQITNDVKRIRISAFDELEEALYIWFDATVKGGTPLSGPLIKG